MYSATMQEDRDPRGAVVVLHYLAGSACQEKGCKQQGCLYSWSLLIPGGAPGTKFFGSSVEVSEQLSANVAVECSKCRSRQQIQQLEIQQMQEQVANIAVENVANVANVGVGTRQDGYARKTGRAIVAPLPASTAQLARYNVMAMMIMMKTVMIMIILIVVIHYILSI